MITKCPNCNGALEYDVISDRMICSHCMGSFMVGELQMAEEKKEQRLRETEQLKRNFAGQAGDGGIQDDLQEDAVMECDIYTCTACGAELMINDVESATYCAYCSQPTIVFDRVSLQRRPK